RVAPGGDFRAARHPRGGALPLRADAAAARRPARLAGGGAGRAVPSPGRDPPDAGSTGFRPGRRVRLRQPLPPDGPYEEPERTCEMSTAEAPSCGCGCSEMTVVTEAQEPCGCGCECCAPGDEGQPKPKEQEVAELRRLLASVNERLAELGEA